jgi:hypothetical protein
VIKKINKPLSSPRRLKVHEDFNKTLWPFVVKKNKPLSSLSRLKEAQRDLFSLNQS